MCVHSARLVTDIIYCIGNSRLESYKRNGWVISNNHCQQSAQILIALIQLWLSLSSDITISWLFIYLLACLRFACYVRLCYQWRSDERAQIPTRTFNSSRAVYTFWSVDNILYGFPLSLFLSFPLGIIWIVCACMVWQCGYGGVCMYEHICLAWMSITLFCSLAVLHKAIKKSNFKLARQSKT